MLTLVTIKDKINELYEAVMEQNNFEDSVNKDDKIRPIPVFLCTTKMEMK